MIGGNTEAFIQTSITSKNEIGESVKAWATVQRLKGWLDFASGDSKYTTYNSKIQESTHVFVADYVPLDEGIKAENARMVISDNRYDVKLIDDPMGMHQQLEFYLAFTGGQ